MSDEKEESHASEIVVYKDLKSVPSWLRKYWHQRTNLFTKFDEGIWMTANAFFGMTPEAVADKIAADIATYAPSSKKVLIDAFSGVGGNTIAFAKSNRWDQIFAIEQDPNVIKCAKHNAAIYGVDKKIFWIEGDVSHVVKWQLRKVAKDAVIFASPPWGGPDYSTVPVFDLKAMEPYSLPKLWELFHESTTDVAMYLPRTSNLNQLAALGTDDTHFDVVHYTEWGASKAICFYSGALAAPRNET